MEFDTSPINRCSKRNEKIYQEWFSSADSDGDGRLIGKDATSFLAMSNLPREDLKQFYELLLMYRFTFSVFPKVWAIADSKRQGYLGFKEFITAMQLVSLAQAGRAVTSDFSNAEEDFRSNAVDFENLEVPSMEGLDKLLAKKKRVAKWVPDSNGQPGALKLPLWAGSGEGSHHKGVSARGCFQGLNPWPPGYMAITLPVTSHVARDSSKILMGVCQILQK
ncbi:hypothetical protein CQW23_23089 [Capsicum baccatum]|uniref:EF-hand domain-containing protein n=1 Tax=Capsicum baccatum TaxID=33114 RepID=A0A2G2VQX9_CAPBA|nr:hypothetical protein CQW23_23089 [Capsicum baccatum]